MNKSSLALLAPLLVVVFLSGCIGQGSTTPGSASGVIIKSFSPDMPEVFSGDPVLFTINVENTGEEVATDVKARIFGLGTDWSGADWTTNKQKSIGTLDRSQPELKLSGGTGDTQWDITSPQGLKVNDNTYTAGVRMTYNYATTALANIRIYNNDYLRSNPDIAQSVMKMSGIETFTVTSAPVTVELAGLARPLIYRTGGAQQATVTILINNIGQGKPYKAAENDMQVTVTGITVNNQNCQPNAAGTYRLPVNGKKSVACTFSLPTVDSYTTMPIEISLNYNYFVDGSTSVKILRSLSTGSQPVTGGGGGGQEPL